MDNTDSELWIYDLSPINGISPRQDFNWLPENTDLGPLQDRNPQHETPELLPHPGPSKRGRKPKLTDSERTERRKISNKKYRLKMKDILKNAIEAEDMVKQAGVLNSENESQLKYIKQLEKEINKLKSQRHVLKTNVQGQSEHVEQMIMGWLVCEPCNATVPAAAAEFFRKLEQDEESNVDFKDFIDLHEKQEYRTVGKYQIPLSLVPTAEKITEVYGDVCATSPISRIIAGKIYILFCATIKEMSELQLEKVTEKTMLKWRDAIKDALCIKFKVEFAMEHLKKTIAPRYFGMKAYKEVEKIDVDVAKLEACLNGLNECEKFIDIAKEFDDKPFSEGLWG